MKTLFYSPVSLQTGGGCERWHCDITNSLKKQFGCKVKIVTGNLGDEKWSAAYLKQQLKGVPYTKVDFPIIFGTLIPTPKIIVFLYKEIKSVDSVHFIFGFMGQDILMLFLKLLTGKKFLVGHHAPIFHSSRIHNWYISHVSRYLMPFFDNHQTLNSADKVFFETRWGIPHVNFIPSGIRIERFIKRTKPSHRKLNFLSVGRYEIQKGFDLQLKAIDIFNKHFKNNLAEFYFVGGGSLKNLINDGSQTKSNVYDLGYVKYENLPSLYAKSDIYLLCSREEPFGLVLIEAWASGIPVLATKTEGPKDMLLPGKNGWFIDNISSESMAKSIGIIYKKWLANKRLFADMSDLCVTTANKFSIDTTAQKMFSFLSP